MVEIARFGHCFEEKAREAMKQRRAANAGAGAQRSGHPSHMNRPSANMGGGAGMERAEKPPAPTLTTEQSREAIKLVLEEVKKPQNQAWRVDSSIPFTRRSISARARVFAQLNP